jgi:XTP/dITP diphosphohydrolase
VLSPNANTAPLTLLLATTNEAKVNRLRGLLEGLNISLELPKIVSRPPRIEEDGDSHQAIAIQKALAWSKAFDGLALASDGGLMVPALGSMWASLTTRRASDKHANDAERATHLLDLMRKLKGSDRAVAWVEAVALADRGNLIEHFQAEGLKGLLAEDYQPAPEGAPGFWVDGLWLHAANGKRRWELNTEERLSLKDPWEALASAVRKTLLGIKTQT